MDHILLSAALMNTSDPLFDIVHLNTGLNTGVPGAASDHDPLIASLRIPTAVVPIPADLPLFVSGLALLYGVRRKPRS